jgi:hypothetical protein
VRSRGTHEDNAAADRDQAELESSRVQPVRCCGGIPAGVEVLLTMPRTSSAAGRPRQRRKCRRWQRRAVRRKGTARAAPVVRHTRPSGTRAPHITGNPPYSNRSYSSGQRGRAGGLRRA